MDLTRCRPIQVMPGITVPGKRSDWRPARPDEIYGLRCMSIDNVSGHCNSMLEQVPPPEEPTTNNAPPAYTAGAPQSCIGLFMTTWAENLFPLSPGPTDFLAFGMGGLGAIRLNQALAYAVTRPNFMGTIGLIYPMRSSVFRSMIGQSTRLAQAGPLIALAAVEYYSLYEEYRAAKAGDCH